MQGEISATNSGENRENCWISEEKSSFVLRRGKLLLPTYGQDLESRQKFWRILCGEEKADPIRLESLCKGESTNEKRKGDVAMKSRKGEYRSAVTTSRSEGDLLHRKPKSKAIGGTEVEGVDETKRLQEMTDHLRNLLRIGDGSPTPEKPANANPTANGLASSTPTPKTPNSVRVDSKPFKTPANRSYHQQSGSKSSSRPRMVSSSPRIFGGVASGSNGAPTPPPRVPFTARTPKPPPFLPSFSDDENEETKKDGESKMAINGGPKVQFSLFDGGSNDEMTPIMELLRRAGANQCRVKSIRKDEEASANQYRSVPKDEKADQYRSMRIEEKTNQNRSIGEKTNQYRSPRDEATSNAGDHVKQNRYPEKSIIGSGSKANGGPKNQYTKTDGHENRYSRSGHQENQYSRKIAQPSATTPISRNAVSFTNGIIYENYVEDDDDVVIWSDNDNTKPNLLLKLFGQN